MEGLGEDVTPIPEWPATHRSDDARGSGEGVAGERSLYGEHLGLSEELRGRPV